MARQVVIAAAKSAWAALLPNIDKIFTLINYCRN